jgi:DNA-binding IclR family transcriptional regulator
LNSKQSARQRLDDPDTMTNNVKSSARTLMILCHFAEERRKLSVSELAKSLGLPLSSCHGLLMTLVDMRFLSFEEETRSYFPTEKVKQLGDWLRSDKLLEQKAVAWAQKLHTELGEAVAVSKRMGLDIEFVFTRQVAQVKRGSHLPICRTNNGLALLCHKSEAEVEAIVSAHNEKFGRQDFVQPRDLIRRVDQQRHRGYITGCAPITPQMGTVCFCLREDNEEIILTVLVPARELSVKAGRIVDAVRRTVPQANWSAELARHH